MSESKPLDVFKRLIQDPSTPMEVILNQANKAKDEDPVFVAQALERFKMRKSTP